MAEDRSRQERSLSPLSRWDPFQELSFFDRAPGQGGASSLFRLLDEMGWPSARGAAAGGSWAPATDLSETEDAYVMRLELPGTKPDDVNVEVHENTLTIRGEKRSEREEGKEQVRWVERTYGSFARSFTLPANADGEKVEASFEDGVLSVRIAKREEAKPRVINVRSS